MPAPDQAGQSTWLTTELLPYVLGSAVEALQVCNRSQRSPHIQNESQLLYWPFQLLLHLLAAQARLGTPFLL